MLSIELPLLSAASRRVAWWRNRPVPAEIFLAHVDHIAHCLPQQRFLINLCEDRYLFLVAFAAGLVRGRTHLLPPSRVSEVINEIGRDYPDSCRLDDAQVQQWLPTGKLTAVGTIPTIPAKHIAAIVFTSGSTGRAQPHPKSWGSLVGGTWLAQQRFGFGKQENTTIIATVPSQHMYGLETTVMVPLVSGVGIHSGRPFFPEDIRATLAAVPAPRILITTPAHLRVCIKSAIAWPAVSFIISATAPLSVLLAAQTEEAFAAPVLEIYGCTEAGSIASRRTLDGDLWQLYDELALSDSVVQGPHLPQPVGLNDIIEPHGGNTFRLLGRQQDLVNVAGKRTSLSYLNNKLSEIEGVEDGVFLLPEEVGGNMTRLAALVVAPGLDKSQILAVLAKQLDPVFLPRPLFKVAQLPRNDTGKLPRSELLALFEGLKKASGEPR
jgi:acyl-coenzyme A synthetase/AMP-(fatty) acid ligase